MAIDANYLFKIQGSTKLFELNDGETTSERISRFEQYVARFNSKSYKLEHAIYLNTLDILNNKPDKFNHWFELIKDYVKKHPEKPESDRHCSIFKFRYEALHFLNRIYWNETSELMKTDEGLYISSESNLKELIFNFRARETENFAFVYDLKQKELINYIGIDCLASKISVNDFISEHDLLNTIPRSQSAKLIFNPLVYKKTISDKVLANPTAVQFVFDRYNKQYYDFKSNNPDKDDYLLLFLYLNGLNEYFKSKNAVENISKVDKLISSINPIIDDSVWKSLALGFDFSDNKQVISAIDVACGMRPACSTENLNLVDLEF